MKHRPYTLLPFGIALLLFSCKPGIDQIAPVKGELDVTNYVAIGSGMSAGYADNALYREAQINSYPNLLAQQFKLIGGGEFNQPLIDAASVGIGGLGNAKLVLGTVQDCSGVSSLSPKPSAAMGDVSIFATLLRPQAPFNNLSVPGLKSITSVYPGYGDFNNGPGNYNAFYSRMASTPETSSVLGEAVTKQPSFFSLCLGYDDVLLFALSGGTQDSITPVSGAPGYGFDGSIGAIVETLASSKTKGVIMNIPALNTFPFFTTVPYNGLTLDTANAAALSMGYAPLGISFQPGANAFIIEDATAPAGLRKIKSDEMILLSIPGDSIKCAGWGSTKPIPNRFVLTTSEINLINAAINNYNDVLKNIAAAKGLAFVDVNAFMNKIKAGFVYNGIKMTTQFVSGSVFSLDGINFTPKGNALLTNEIIKALNARYGSTIPQLDAGLYRSIVFP